MRTWHYDKDKDAMVADCEEHEFHEWRGREWVLLADLVAPDADTVGVIDRFINHDALARAALARQKELLREGADLVDTDNCSPELLDWVGQVKTEIPHNLPRERLKAAYVLALGLGPGIRLHMGDEVDDYNRLLEVLR